MASLFIRSSMTVLLLFETSVSELSMRNRICSARFAAAAASARAKAVSFTAKVFSPAA